MWWSNKTLNFTLMLQFHVSHVSWVCCNFTLVTLYYQVAMFQGMRNPCCIHMLHYYHSQTSKYETNIIENVAYACFSTMAWWDRWCTCLWNEMHFCGSQTPRVLHRVALRVSHGASTTPLTIFSRAPHKLPCVLWLRSCHQAFYEVATSKSNKHQQLATRTPSATRCNLTM